MDGSAAVIGEMMLPILEPTDLDRALAARARLGNAFQLTNFLRDIDEDLDRGRQYVPQEDLRRFGVDLCQRRASPELSALMRFEIERCRALYRSADVGIAMLPAARPAACAPPASCTARSSTASSAAATTCSRGVRGCRRGRRRRWWRERSVAERASQPRWPRDAAAAVAAPAMVATPLAQRQGRVRRALVPAVVGGLAVASTLSAARRWSPCRAALAAGAVLPATALIEATGTRTGVPFGRYAYSGRCVRRSVGSR